jgi:predicted Zn-dependent protease
VCTDNSWTSSITCFEDKSLLDKWNFRICILRFDRKCYLPVQLKKSASLQTNLISINRVFQNIFEHTGSACPQNFLD